MSKETNNLQESDQKAITALLSKLSLLQQQPPNSTQTDLKTFIEINEPFLPHHLIPSFDPLPLSSPLDSDKDLAIDNLKFERNLFAKIARLEIQEETPSFLKKNDQKKMVRFDIAEDTDTTEPLSSEDGGFSSTDEDVPVERSRVNNDIPKRKGAMNYIVVERDLVEDVKIGQDDDTVDEDELELEFLGKQIGQAYFEKKRLMGLGKYLDDDDDDDDEESGFCKPHKYYYSQQDSKMPPIDQSFIDYMNSQENDIIPSTSNNTNVNYVKSTKNEVKRVSKFKNDLVKPKIVPRPTKKKDEVVRDRLF